MARDDALLVGTAGEHFVAFRLAQLGCVVAIPRGGSPAVDLLVSNRAGTKTVTVQVKTAEWAQRYRGRGEEKRLDHLEFPLGHRAVGFSPRRFIYAFVDLQGREPNSAPDVYIVPAEIVRQYADEWAHVKWLRYHPPIEEVEPYKNRWRLITQLLR